MTAVRMHAGRFGDLAGGAVDGAAGEHVAELRDQLVRACLGIDLNISENLSGC